MNSVLFCEADPKAASLLFYNITINTQYCYVVCDVGVNADLFRSKYFILICQDLDPNSSTTKLNIHIPYI